MPPVTGVVLAGGRSSRFGDRDKLAEPYLGEPLLHRPVRALDELCEEIIVVIAPDAAGPSLPELTSDVRVVRDTRADQGPLVGLTSALAVVWTELALTVGGDMPELSVDVLRGMVRAARARADLSAVVLADGDGWRPLPLVIRPDVRREAQVLLRHPGSSLRDLVRSVPFEVVPEDAWRRFDPSGKTLSDIDTPWDLPGAGGAGTPTPD